MRGISPFRNVTFTNKEEEERHFLDFVMHCSGKDRTSPGTLKSRQAAIRSRHLAEGYDDPLLHSRQVHMAVAGVKRRYKQPSRRRPVTVRMLRWTRAHLDPTTRRDDAALLCAVTLGFFFLLRASKYLRNDGELYDPRRGLRGRDITLWKEGRPTAAHETADEIRLYIRRSKMDQYNQGELKNHYRVTGEELCVVQAYEAYIRHAPEKRAGASHEDEHLLTWSNGKPLQREEVHAVLAQAAAACGVPPDLIGSHSLRFGGILAPTPTLSLIGPRFAIHALFAGGAAGSQISTNPIYGIPAALRTASLMPCARQT